MWILGNVVNDFHPTEHMQIKTSNEETLFRIDWKTWQMLGRNFINPSDKLFIAVNLMR